MIQVASPLRRLADDTMSRLRGVGMLLISYGVHQATGVTVRLNEQMDRVSSPSACSSSSFAQAQPTTTCWFPSCMKQKQMRLIVGNLSYTGHVDFVDDLKCSLRFKLPNAMVWACPRFLQGHLATLQSAEGTRWSGEIISIDENKSKECPSGCTNFLIRVPAAGEILESLENVLLTIKPLPKAEPSQEMVKLIVKGFGKIERFIIEMGLQSIDVQVVAIQTTSSIEYMANIWKSPNISISVKDSETLIFTKRYYEGNAKENQVTVLLEHNEMAVLREPNQTPWEQVNADFVVECSTDKHAQSNDQSQVTNKTEGSNNCLRCLPKVLDAFGLYADRIKRAKFRNAFPDDHETATRAARFNIVTRSTAAVGAVRHAEIFPDWNQDPASMSFHATTTLSALHRLADIEMSNVDLEVTLANIENCSGIESIRTRFCDADKKVHRRLKAILSWCLDIIRCMPVGACCLELA